MTNKKQKMVEAFWVSGMCFICCMVIGFVATAAWVASVDWVTNNTNWTLYSWRIAEQLHGRSRLECIQMEYVTVTVLSVFCSVRTFVKLYR